MIFSVVPRKIPMRQVKNSHVVWVPENWYYKMMHIRGGSRHFNFKHRAQGAEYYRLFSSTYIHIPVVCLYISHQYMDWCYSSFFHVTYFSSPSQTSSIKGLSSQSVILLSHSVSAKVLGIARRERVKHSKYFSRLATTLEMVPHRFLAVTPNRWAFDQSAASSPVPS